MRVFMFYKKDTNYKLEVNQYDEFWYNSDGIKQVDLQFVTSSGELTKPCFCLWQALVNDALLMYDAITEQATGSHNDVEFYEKHLLNMKCHVFKHMTKDIGEDIGVVSYELDAMDLQYLDSKYGCLEDIVYDGLFYNTYEQQYMHDCRMYNIIAEQICELFPKLPDEVCNIFYGITSLNKAIIII